MSSESEIEVKSEDEEPNSEVQSEPLRHSMRQKKQPNYYGREHSRLTKTPITFKDANAMSRKCKMERNNE